MKRCSLELVYRREPRRPARVVGNTIEIMRSVFGGWWVARGRNTDISIVGN